MPVGDHAEDARANGTSSLDYDTAYEPDVELQYSPDLSTYDIEPIAVFEQVASHHSAPFHFAGYYKLTSLEYLAPQSRELVQLLEQKFTTTDGLGRVKQLRRKAASWRSSLQRRWAVIGMEKDQDANVSLPPPKIEVRSNLADYRDASSPGKSVNELLKERRLED